MVSIFDLNYVRYGILMSALTLLCLFILHSVGDFAGTKNESALFVIFAFGAPFAVWYLGLSAKKKALKNKMSYKQGLTEGFKIAVVYGLTSPFVFATYYLFFNPELLGYVRATYNLNEASSATVILVDMAAQFLGAIVVGTIYAAVISLFLKSKHSSSK